MSICTGTNDPRTCPSCHVRQAPCMLGRGETVTPMNQAAREAMDKQGEPYDRKASERLERFFGLDEQ